MIIIVNYLVIFTLLIFLGHQYPAVDHMKQGSPETDQSFKGAAKAVRNTLDKHALLLTRAWRGDCAGAAAAMGVGKGTGGGQSPHWILKFAILLLNFA